MSSITELRVWRDTGYRDGALEVPSKTSSLPSPTYTFTDVLQPSRDSLFSVIKLKHEFEYLYDCSYLAVDYEWSDGTRFTIYGWIDAVSCTSDTDTNPVTTIAWHVDHWRTYLPKADFGAGKVLRRKPTSSDPPQSYPSYLWRATESTDILPVYHWSRLNGDIWWVYMNYNTSGSVTATNTVCFPVMKGDDGYLNHRLSIGYSTQTKTSGKAPSLVDALNGSVDEALSINPDSVFGVFISPVAPCSFDIVEPEGDTVFFGIDPTKWSVDTKGDYTYFYGGTNVNAYPVQHISFEPKTSGDTEGFVLVGPDNSPIASFPWGYTIGSLDYTTVNNDTSMYIRFRVNDKNSGAEGTEWSWPLPSLPLNSNALSGYVYSGEREYNRRMQDEQRSASFWSSIASLGGEAANAGVMGAVAGATQQGEVSKDYRMTVANPATGAATDPFVVPIPKRTSGAAVGALAGGAAGLLGGVISAVGSNYVQGLANEQYLNYDYQYRSSQASSLTIAGTGEDVVMHGRNAFSLVRLEMDSYSKDNRQRDIGIYGVHVSESRTDCNTLINQGGPVQIANCNVTGPIPVESKQYIVNRLAGGLRLV